MADKQRRPHEIAQGALGLSEEKNLPAIRDYLSTGGVNLDPATKAWCAAFVNASLGQAGEPQSGSNLAQGFLDYGEPVLSPREGDIAVFKRPGNKPEERGLGHAGFYMGEEHPGYADILGGNQGSRTSQGEVSQKPIDMANLLSFQRPPGAPPEPPTPDPFTANLSRPFTQQKGNFIAPPMNTALSTGGGSMTPRIGNALQGNEWMAQLGTNRNDFARMVQQQRRTPLRGRPV